MDQRFFLCLALVAGCDSSDGTLVCDGADLLTDPNNCGECGYSCGGGTCGDGVCGPSTLATGQDKPSGLAVDDAHVVWTTEGAMKGDPTGTIAACGVGGCADTGPSILYDKLGRPANPILVGDKVYFVHGVLGTVGGDITGFVPEVGDFTSKSLGLPLMWWGSGRDVSSLAVADDKIYFATLEQYSGANDAFAAMCPAAGCPNDGVDFYGLAVDTKSITSIIVDAANAYYVEAGSASIVKASRSSGNPQPLFTGELGALFLAQDSDSLYWGTSVPQQQGLTVKNYLARGGKTGGAKQKLADVGAVASIAVDADWVYFADGGGTVGRVAKTGGTVEVLAADQKGPRGLAVAGGFLYWVNHDGGTVHRLKL